uniref:Biogenesis of lysosome-related organelles complex 1 subunit 7 n=1 Tax=Rattus norvegicus TaxID=10116 RepID=A0A8L2UJD2_RAT
GLHFPAIPLLSGLFLSAPSRRTAAAYSSRRPSRQAEGVRAVRDGRGWFRCRVWGRDPSGGAHRPRPLCRGAPGVPATCCAATRLSRARGQAFVPLCRESQVELREQIDNLATELCRINEDQKVALDLDPYVKKLLNARRRVVLVNNILQNAQERLRRLNHSVAKETARRRAMLDSGVYPPGSPSK